MLCKSIRPGAWQLFLSSVKLISRGNSHVQPGKDCQLPRYFTKYFAILKLDARNPANGTNDPHKNTIAAKDLRILLVICFRGHVILASAMS